MRVGFGVTLLNRCLGSGGVDGIGSYTRELLQVLSRRDDVEVSPISFGIPEPLGDQSQLGCEVLPRFDVSSLISLVTGLSFRGANRLTGRLDIFHATDHRIPKLNKVPVVATLMDAIPLSHPEWVTTNRLGAFKHDLWRSTAKWATHVITISDYSKKEIACHFGLSPEMISVIPLGVDERWFRVISPEIMADVVARHDLPERFFLFVGTLQPRKNVGRLIEAYLTLPRSVRDDVPLLIVGRAGWQCDDIVRGLEKRAYGPSVRWLQHLPDADLLAVLKRATALVFPSLYEGFGLPVLEAFAAGVTVITSNTTALPEVAGDAALLVDPENISAISTAMMRVLEDEVFARTLAVKGTARARDFTWEKTAALTVDVYKRVLKQA